MFTKEKLLKERYIKGSTISLNEAMKILKIARIYLKNR